MIKLYYKIRFAIRMWFADRRAKKAEMLASLASGDVDAATLPSAAEVAVDPPKLPPCE